MDRSQDSCFMWQLPSYIVGCSLFTSFIAYTQRVARQSPYFALLCSGYVLSTTRSRPLRLTAVSHSGLYRSYKYMKRQLCSSLNSPHGVYWGLWIHQSPHTRKWVCLSCIRTFLSESLMQGCYYPMDYLKYLSPFHLLSAVLMLHLPGLSTESEWTQHDCLTLNELRRFRWDP